MSSIDRYRVRPGRKINLSKIPSAENGGLRKQDAQPEFAKLQQRLSDLQELLYAEAKHALLIVLQAMDTAGKDSTIRSVFGAFNPLGCPVASFKAPNDVELRHDFLWRIHKNVPRLGYVGVFNRSHYEDVLIARVKNLVPKQRWRSRYEHINNFENMLHDEGTTIVKFYLHISKDYQKKRLERRLAKPDKHWKFDPADLEERKRWGDYQAAYEETFRRCSTSYAPWYIIPSECRWYRDLLVARILVQTLEKLDMHFPEPTFDPKAMVIK